MAVSLARCFAASPSAFYYSTMSPGHPYRRGAGRGGRHFDSGAWQSVSAALAGSGLAGGIGALGAGSCASTEEVRVMTASMVVTASPSGRSPPLADRPWLGLALTGLLAGPIDVVC